MSQHCHQRRRRRHHQYYHLPILISFSNSMLSAVLSDKTTRMNKWALPARGICLVTTTTRYPGNILLTPDTSCYLPTLDLHPGKTRVVM